MGQGALEIQAGHPQRTASCGYDAGKCALHPQECDRLSADARFSPAEWERSLPETDICARAASQRQWHPAPSRVHHGEMTAQLRFPGAAYGLIEKMVPADSLPVPPVTVVPY